MLEIVLRLTLVAEKERQKSAERQELLIAELNHRVRNILGLVHGLVAQSQSSAVSVEDFAGVLGGRVQALARAYDQITTQHWGPGTLRALIVAEAAAYVTVKSEDRVRCTGPAVLLQPSFRHHHHRAHDPARPKGEADIRYHLAGLRAKLTIPAHFVTAGEAALPKTVAVRPAAVAPLSGNVLLLEDNIIIALDAGDMLRKLGARHVEIASNSDQVATCTASLASSCAARRTCRRVGAV